MVMILQILVLGLAFIVVRKIIDIRKTYRCVSDQDIRDYFDGRLKKLDKQQYDRTIAHLGVCEKCQAKLESMVDSKPDDTDIESHLIS